MVKNLPAMWETWVRSLGWKDPLGEGTATHSSILLENPTVHWVTELDTTERLSTHTNTYTYIQNIQTTLKT